MSDMELNINYLIACIDSINQLKDVPAADELKTMVNDWVDSKITTAVNDPDSAVKIYYNWKKISGDSEAQKLISWIEEMPVSDSSNELKVIVNRFVSAKLTEALANPENRINFFRSWLSLSTENVDTTFTIVIDKPAGDDETPLNPGDTGRLNWPRW